MTKRTRTTLFLLFLTFFLVAIPLIVLYSQGYRIDWAERRIVETGAIDLSIQPIDMRVYLDGELKESTNFIFRNAIVRNLLPATYHVSVERANYQTWEKDIEVHERHVAKFPSVRLFRHVLEDELVTTSIQEASFSPQTRFAFGVRRLEGNASQLVFIRLANNEVFPVKTLATNEKLIASGWSDDASTLWFATQSLQRQQIFTLATNNPTFLNDWTALLQSTYAPFDVKQRPLTATRSAQTFLVRSEVSNNLFRIDALTLDTGLLTRGLVATAHVGVLRDTTLYIIDEDGVLSRQGLNEENPTSLSTELAAAIATEADWHLIVREDGEAIAVLSDTSLYLWQSGGPLKRIAERPSGVAFSPDGEKLAYWTGDTITAYWLEDVFGPPQRATGDTETITMSQGITTAFWLGTSAHLVIATDQRAAIAELDSRGGRNVISYGLDLPAAFAFSRDRDTFYTVSQETGNFVLHAL